MSDKDLIVVEAKDLEVIPVGKTEARGFKPLGKYTGAAGEYEVYAFDGAPLVATDTYAIYVAKLPSGQMGLMMISQGPDCNDAVDQAGRVLETMNKIAIEEDADAKTEGQREPNYAAFFPVLIESFVPEGVYKQVLFLGYHPSIATYKQLVPLSVAAAKQRVDLQTGAWMIAKGAKLLGFVHGLGFTVGFMDPSNILLETGQHGVFALDFTNANEDASDRDGKAEVRAYARLVWNACGGTDTENPPHDKDVMSKEHYDDFVAFLQDLIEGDWNADDVVPELYKKADVYWPKVGIEGDVAKGLKRQFHPWKLLPR